VDETGRAYSMHGREEECIQGFGRKTEEMTQLGKPRITGQKIILKWIQKKEAGVVWTGLIWLRIMTGSRLL
jgi:hypothetical protein